MPPITQQPFSIQSGPRQVDVAQPALDSFQSYQDAAYQQAQRYLQPQLQSEDRRFQQQMINKGLQPGSEAHKLALQNLQRGQNDRLNAATFGAMQFGLGAQNQAYNQGLGAARLAAQGEALDVNEQLARARLAQQESQFGRSFGLQSEQADFGNLMSLGNLAFGLGNFANQGILTDYNMGQTLLGMAPGMMNQQVNVTGAYNTGQQGAIAQGQLDQSGRNSFYGGLGQLAGGLALLSGEKYKRIYGKTDDKSRKMISSHMLSMPVYDWDYLPEYREPNDAIRCGPLAEDFSKNVVGVEQDTIDIQRYMAAMHITMQELWKEVQRLETMLFHAVNASGVVFNDGTNESRDTLSDRVESVIERAARYYREDIENATQ